MRGVGAVVLLHGARRACAGSFAYWCDVILTLPRATLIESNAPSATSLNCGSVQHLVICLAVTYISVSRMPEAKHLIYGVSLCLEQVWCRYVEQGFTEGWMDLSTNTSNAWHALKPDCIDIYISASSQIQARYIIIKPDASQIPLIYHFQARYKPDTIDISSSSQIHTIAYMSIELDSIDISSSSRIHTMILSSLDLTFNIVFTTTADGKDNIIIFWTMS